MPRRRSGRFVLEALFLVGVAAAVTVAELRPAGVIVLMALAWVIVALIEWTAWLDEPHYGRGLPPRYYVPQVALPPPRPIDQPGHYPVILEPDDEPTFVASVTEWAAELGDWPVMGTSPVDEETEIAAPDEPLDYGLEFEDEPAAQREIEPDFLPEPEFPRPIVPPAHLETMREFEPEPPVEEAAAVAGPEPVEELPEPVAEPEPAKPRLVPVARTAAITIHHVDPLGSSARRRLFRRSVDEAVVEVPDGPPPDRMLPGHAARAKAGSE